MTPAAALVAVANCASAAALPSISALTIGMDGVADETACCDNGFIAAELVSISQTDDGSDSVMDTCDGTDVLAIRLTVGRCVAQFDKSPTGVASGAAVPPATVSSISAQQMLDAANIYGALKVCLTDLVDTSPDVHLARIDIQTYSRAAGCAKSVTDLEITVSL